MQHRQYVVKGQPWLGGGGGKGVWGGGTGIKLYPQTWRIVATDDPRKYMQILRKMVQKSDNCIYYES